MRLWPERPAATGSSSSMLPRVDVSSYPATAEAGKLYLCGGAGGVLNLPEGAGTDFQLEVINDSAGSVTLTPAAGQTITGLPSYVMAAGESSLRLRWCGDDYQIL